jgi:hypothetical protein
MIAAKAMGMASRASVTPAVCVARHAVAAPTVMVSPSSAGIAVTADARFGPAGTGVTCDEQHARLSPPMTTAMRGSRAATVPTAAVATRRRRSVGRRPRPEHDRDDQRRRATGEPRCCGLERSTRASSASYRTAPLSHPAMLLGPERRWGPRGEPVGSVKNAVRVGRADTVDGDEGACRAETCHRHPGKDFRETSLQDRAGEYPASAGSRGARAAGSHPGKDRILQRKRRRHRQQDREVLALVLQLLAEGTATGALAQVAADVNPPETATAER